MKAVKRWLERVERNRITNNFDAFVLVIGGEGVGKSTFMAATTWLWQQIREKEPTPDSVLERMAHDDREAFRQLLLNSDTGDAIIANDAAHILHRKETMHGDQIETEKSLLDIRTFNYLVLFGYQDWGDITDQLQRRRAHFCFKIPRRGVIHGYSRSSMDEKYDTDDWPSPDLKDTFPNLEGTELWEQFTKTDEERKLERLQKNETPDVKDVAKQEQIKTALRAVKPWSDDQGMTQRDATQLVDYSRGWISERVGEWRRGEHRDLIDDVDTDAPSASAT